jgi:phage/plasmid-like protein (TIGR03299 family)
MAHELDFRTDGTASAAFALQPAWHGLGTVLDCVPGAEQMLQAAGIDWTVAKVPLQTDEGAEVPDYFATVRRDSGDVLGVVSDQYTVVQNREAFAFLDSLVDEGGLKYESAGALRGGRVVWALARMPSFDEIAPGDRSMRYLLFATSHDGSAALHAIPTSVRVVCANTYRAATAKSIGIRHTGDVKGKLDQARLYLSQFDEGFSLFRDRARMIAEKRWSPDQAREYIETLFPMPKDDDSGRSRTIRENKVSQIRRNLVNPRNAMPSIKGTWWSLYNAVSEYVDHDSRRDYTKRAAKETRMLSVLNGAGAELKDKAFSLALRMAG